MENITEDQLTHGAVPDPRDDRDFIYEKTFGAAQLVTDQEWQAGYNIEKEIGMNLRPNNQWTSYSCVGQAFAKYTSVLNFIETGVWDEVSPKAIYSQITLGYGQGAYMRDAASLIVDWGSVFNKIVDYLRENGTTDENWMMDKTWLTPAIATMAKILQSKEYRLVTSNGIDAFARAIKDGHGVVLGVTGINNGTWTSTYPMPPKLTDPQGQMWGHAIFAGRFRINNGKKEIGVLNSWGNIGENNTGWQWLGEEWFADEGRWIFNPWVLIDKPNNEVNNNNNMILKKEIGKPDIWLIIEKNKTKINITDMPSFTALQENFTEVPSLSGYAENGSIIWLDRKIN